MDAAKRGGRRDGGLVGVGGEQGENTKITSNQSRWDDACSDSRGLGFDEREKDANCTMPCAATKYPKVKSTLKYRERRRRSTRGATNPELWPG